MADIRQLVSRSLGATTEELQRLRQLRDEREVVTLVVGNSNLHPTYIEPFYEALEEGGRQDSLDLFLHTSGGQAEVPWALVSLLRQFAEKLSVLVPFRAMSGGTHMALAGEELVMGPLSCLGSVDPKRSHHLLPRENVPHSVQDLKHCMDFIDDQWIERGRGLGSVLGRRARSRQIGQIVTELFEHVHPLAIGALEQSYELSRLITRKVLEGRRDFVAGDPRIQKIEDRLAGEYYSHSFFILRDDVESDLGLPVVRPPDDLWQAMRDLDRSYRSRFRWIQDKELHVETVAFIENSRTRRVLIRVFEGGREKEHLRGEEWVEA